MTQRFGPERAFFFDDAAYVFNGFYHVFARALGNLQGDRRTSIDPGKTCGILESAPNFGDVADPYHSVAIGFNGKLNDVFNALEQAGHFYRESAPAGILDACGYQQVGAFHRPCRDSGIKTITL